MVQRKLTNSTDELFRLSGLFADKTEQPEEKETVEFDVPSAEELSALSDEDLTAKLNEGVKLFNSVYGEGNNLDSEDLETLSALTTGIETLRAEDKSREESRSERVQNAQELAQRVNGDEEEGTTGEDKSDEEDPEDSAEEEQEDSEEESAEQPDAVAAGGSKGPIAINMTHVKARQRHSKSQRKADEPVAPKLSDMVSAAPDVPGFSNGQGMEWGDLGTAIDRRLTNFNASQYEAANRSGRHIRQQFGVAVIRKPFNEGTLIESDNPEEAANAMTAAANESKLPGGSLVASGGWCAPSETMYDFMETETRDGLFSLPEVGVKRGGIRFTQGPDFSDIYANMDTGSWQVTEAEDEDGDYQNSGSESDKPCFKIECPDFTEVRLGLAGLCLSAGLLQQRGYPEIIARTVRGSLVAHDHLMSKRLIDSVVAGSTAIAMPTDQVGTTAPLLTAIELQAQHYRDLHRIGVGATLEAVFPTWVHGAVRADLARRQGVDLIAVPDSRINAWFTNLGINPQFVYNWQDLGSTDAAALTKYPEAVKFLLYQAGTWIRGTADVITLDTVYDSNTLAQNDYTALFTEEGWLTAMRGHDSRVITVPVCADGGTNGGLVIDCDGTEVAAAAV